MIPKLQLYQISSKNNLKANHNLCSIISVVIGVVSNIVKEQFESKSQR